MPRQQEALGSPSHALAQGASPSGVQLGAAAASATPLGGGGEAPQPLARAFGRQACTDPRASAVAHHLWVARPPLSPGDCCAGALNLF